jgi:hypothetical protein
MEEWQRVYAEKGGEALADLLRGSRTLEDEQKPLDDGQLEKLVPHTPLKTYPELLKCRKIEDFTRGGDAILLYLIESATEGHWVGIIEQGPRIEYFDSYGHRPDEPLGWIKPRQATALNEGHPELTDLLKKAAKDGKRVVYNTRAFQDRRKPSLATCGRHVACRLSCSRMPLAEYGKMIDSTGMDPDDFVTCATDFALAKGLKGGV